MYIFEALNKIKQVGICVKPFQNYEASNYTERHETGAHFKSDHNEWPISKVEFSSQGNLNLMFVIPGKLKVTETQSHNCSEIRYITIVQNGELKLQYLQLDSNKELQAQLIAAGVSVKNNIVDLSKFALTDRTDFSIEEVSRIAVHSKLKELKKVPVVRPVRELTREEQMLAMLGLKNGMYTAPVSGNTVVIPNDKCKVKLKGLSSKTCKLAQTLKDLDVQVEDVDLGRAIYDAKCLKIHGDYNLSYRLTDTLTITGTVNL